MISQTSYFCRSTVTTIYHHQHQRDQTLRQQGENRLSILLAGTAKIAVGSVQIVYLRVYSIYEMRVSKTIHILIPIYPAVYKGISYNRPSYTRAARKK